MSDQEGKNHFFSVKDHSGFQKVILLSVLAVSEKYPIFGNNVSNSTKSLINLQFYPGNCLTLTAPKFQILLNLFLASWKFSI